MRSRCLYQPYWEPIALRRPAQSGDGDFCSLVSATIEPIRPTCCPYTASPNIGGGDSRPVKAADFDGNMEASGDPNGSRRCCSCQSPVSTSMHPSPTISLISRVTIPPEGDLTITKSLVALTPPCHNMPSLCIGSGGQGGSQSKSAPGPFLS